MPSLYFGMKGEQMTEVWKRIFARYIRSYESIELLAKEEIFDEEEKAVHEHNLLFQIIQTMRSEVEE